VYTSHTRVYIGCIPPIPGVCIGVSLPYPGMYIGYPSHTQGCVRCVPLSYPGCVRCVPLSYPGWKSLRRLLSSQGGNLCADCSPSLGILWEKPLRRVLLLLPEDVRNLCADCSPLSLFVWESCGEESLSGSRKGRIKLIILTVLSRNEQF